MGILDDAIREHLDLKRRQGAEEDELQRLEDEAFGPPSRPGDPDFPAAEAENAEGAPETGESAVAVEPASEEQPTASEPAVAEPAAPESAPEPTGGGFYDQSDEVPASEVAEPPSGPPEAPIESLDTVEHPFEDAAGDTGEADVVQEPLPGEQPATGEEPLTGEEEVVEGEVTDAEEGEDVLEETPEFLRDQPEDDELWFEQGEPKDFDF
jgi:hypothetical protein